MYRLDMKRGSGVRGAGTMAAAIGVAALLLFGSARWVDHAAGGGSAAAEGKKVAGTGGNAMFRYSRSGYDITPWTAAEVEAARARLTPEQERIAFHADTEPPFCGIYTDKKEAGIYVSVVSGLPLFRSGAKFISKSGWASFFEPVDPGHIIQKEDRSHGMIRTEILDARSGAHLGHLFDDGPAPTGLRYCVNSAALLFLPEGTPLPPESLPVPAENAYFAGGCFWGTEDEFSKVPGVIDAVSGYMGGTVPDPTYQQVCGGRTGHAETVRVTFDPARLAYEDLLRVFFEIHDPTTLNRQGPDVGEQYRSAIFAATDEQASKARAHVASLQGSAKQLGRPIVTKIEPAGPFYPAEDYHQDYHARRGGSCRY